MAEGDEGASAGGVHLIQCDGSSGVITVSCSLSVTGPNSIWQSYPSYPTYGDWTWPGCSVNTSFSVTPIEVGIGLGGITEDLSSPNLMESILIGQGCTADAVLLNAPAGVTAGIPTWTVSGNAYLSFNIGSNQTTGQAMPFISPVTAPTISFYWAWCGSPQTVTASVPVLYTPPGSTTPQVIGNAIGSYLVNIEWPVLVYPGTGQSVNGYPALGNEGISISNTVYGNGSVITNSQPRLEDGILLAAGVATPEVFVSSMVNGSPTGYWGWLQLCQLNDTVGGSNAMTSYELDSAFPFNTAAGGGDTPEAPFPCDSTSQPHPAYLLFQDSPSDPWNAYATSFAFNNSFHLYIMYQPPNIGYGANWVPLEMWQWGYSASISRPSPTSSNWTPNPPGSVTFSGFSLFPSYPQWNAKFESGG